MTRFSDKPCRLKDYLSKGGSRYSFADLTQQECQIAFQYWVAYVRKDLPDTVAQQNAICPLLYCGKVFDNLESYLHHVSVCPWLSNGWYRCPGCHRREKFTPPSPKGGEISEQVDPRKETKLRRAVSFFKHFGGWKILTRQNNASPSLACKTNPLHRWHMKRRIRDKSELEARPYKSWLHELDTMDYGLDGMEQHDVKDQKTPSVCGFESKSQIDVTGVRIGPGPKCSSASAIPLELHGSDPLCYELQGSGLQRPELSAESSSRAQCDYLMDLDEPEAFDFICPISPTLTIRESTFTPLSDLVSPISPVDSSAWSDLLSPISPIENSSLSDLFSRIPPVESPSTQWPSRSQLRRPVLSVVTNTETPNTKSPSRSTKDDNGPSQPSKHFSNGAIRPLSSKLVNGCTNGLLSKDGLPTSQTLIKNVRDLVSVLNDYWIKNLSSVPGLPARMAQLQRDSAVEKGLQSIQHCFRGVLPRTFTEIFSLAELAFACAYIIYENDDAYSWDGFFRDVLQLGQAIGDKEDQRLFTQIAFLIWSPPEMPELVRQGVVQAKRPFQAPPTVSIESPFNSNYYAWLYDGSASSSRLQQFEQSSRLSARVEDQADILDTLKNGKVLKVCSHYLDGKSLSRNTGLLSAN